MSRITVCRMDGGQGRRDLRQMPRRKLAQPFPSHEMWGAREPGQRLWGHRVPSTLGTGRTAAWPSTGHILVSNIVTYFAVLLCLSLAPLPPPSLLLSSSSVITYLSIVLSDLFSQPFPHWDVFEFPLFSTL